MINNPICILLNVTWLLESNPAHEKKFFKKCLIPIGPSSGRIKPGCSILAKWRSGKDSLLLDPEASIREVGDELGLYSEKLVPDILDECRREQYLLLVLDGVEDDARCVIQFLNANDLHSIESSEVGLRLEVFDVPPAQRTTVIAEAPAKALSTFGELLDPDLFGVHESEFINQRHIVMSLVSHIMRLKSGDNLRFPITVQKVAEQLGELLRNPASPIQIKSIEKNHLELWASVQGQHYSFVDGGMTKISKFGDFEPLGVRVGIYTVSPGEGDVEKREKWRMLPFILGDVIDSTHGVKEGTERKRLYEGLRYIVEPLAALRHILTHQPCDAIFLHGPLINRFAMYDEGPPHYLPSFDPGFLLQYGISKENILAELPEVPEDAEDGHLLWNQMMAVYGYITRIVIRNDIPMIGVVERASGRAITLAILSTLEKDGMIQKRYRKAIEELLNRFDINDDFLFGCILKEREYVGPVEIVKTVKRQAREQWHGVVDLYDNPLCSIMKTTDVKFPFRIEMNRSAATSESFLNILIYHMSRLLPQYAFPVGLDIADKYAKVPDWISRGVSAQAAAALMHQALKSGDPVIINQTRLLVASTPRDFWFRPQS